jgi:hypothetical protein
MKAFLISKMSGTEPLAAFTEDDGTQVNRVLCDVKLGYGTYLVAGTAAHITALLADSNVTGLLTVTETAGKWPELAGAVNDTHRLAWNTWATPKGLPAITAGMTYRQAVTLIYGAMNSHFNIDQFDVIDVAG